MAESLRDSGQLTDDQRKTKALEKVTVTAKISSAISLAVDLAAALFVPHEADKVANNTAEKETTAPTTVVQ